MPASGGVRPPFRRLHVMQQVTMFSQSFRPPWATGTTWSKVNSDVANTSPQYWHEWSGVDIGAGERNVIDRPLDPDVPEQPDDRGQTEAELDRPDFPVVVLRDNLNLPLAHQRHRLLPVDDLEGLVRRVQKERLLHN